MIKQWFADLIQGASIKLLGSLSKDQIIVLFTESWQEWLKNGSANTLPVVGVYFREKSIKTWDDCSFNLPILISNMCAAMSVSNVFCH